MKNALYVLLGVIAGFILAGTLVFVSRAPAGKPIVLQPAPTTAPIEVHVIGAVPRPGLYKFPEGARVQDAIDAAGGLLSSADENAINLAALLEDGQQLDIPYADGSAPVNDTNSNNLPSSETETPTNNSGVELININTATLEELDTLPEISLSNAQKIIDYREANGPFDTIDSILNVPTISLPMFDAIKDLITV